MKTVLLPVPKKFQRSIGKIDIEVIEFLFRTKLMPNGYKVTMAAIYTVEAPHILAMGASACSPEDVLDRQEAAGRALGRARQQALYWITGKLLPSLIGPAGEAVLEPFNVNCTNVKTVVSMFECAVAENAELANVRDALYKLRKAHSTFDFKEILDEVF